MGHNSPKRTARGALQDVCDCGAAGDGKTLCTEAFGRAIENCARAGGGVVRCPPGDYVSGTITLKSHATLMFDLPITQGSAKNSTLLIKAAGVNPHVPSSPTVSITLDGNYHPTTMSGTGSQTIDGAVYTFTWEATFVAPPPEPPTPAAL